jgi:ABC-type uncharacterized transport system ATPase component
MRAIVQATVTPGLWISHHSITNKSAYLPNDDAPMNRILVVGNAGAGKSTFARRIGGKLALPVIHSIPIFGGPDGGFQSIQHGGNST